MTLTLKGAEIMTKLAVKAIPDGMHSITPLLTCAGASDAIKFYKKAFGAVEVSRLDDKDGKVANAMIKIGNSAVMLMDEMPDMKAFGPKKLEGSPVTIHLQVEDVDAVFKKAVAAGATVHMPVADVFWGDRYGALEDPFGHHWSVATHIRDVSPEEMKQAVGKMAG
jgi:PhnB protein